MTRIADITRVLAGALAALVLVGILTPACAMPDCDETGTSICADYKPVCGDCPDTVVMKHAPDDGALAAAPWAESPGVTGALSVPGAVAVADRSRPLPETRAAPPPIDPLGVRLTI